MIACLDGAVLEKECQHECEMGGEGRGETYSAAAGAGLAGALDGSAARGARAVAVVDGLHLV